MTFLDDCKKDFMKKSTIKYDKHDEKAIKKLLKNGKISIKKFEKVTKTLAHMDWLQFSRLCPECSDPVGTFNKFCEKCGSELPEYEDGKDVIGMNTEIAVDIIEIIKSTS